MQIIVSRLRVLLVWVAVVAAHLTAPASAATFWWDTTATSLWTDGANWSNNATSGGTTGTLPTNNTTTDNVVFNQSSVNGDTIVQLNADRSIRGIVIANTGSTTLQSDSATPRLLTLGADGIVVNAGAGAVTLGIAANPLNLAMSVTGSINNNSSNLVTVNSNISRTAGDTTTRRLFIGGTGNTVLNGVLSNGGGSGVFEVFKAGAGTLTLTGANTFSGQAALTPTGSSNGTVLIGVASVGSVGAITSSAFGTGTISLGLGGSVTIAGNDSVTARTILNPIVGSNLGGNLTFGDGVNNASIELAGGYSSWFTGGITNNLGGSGVLTISGPVNIVDNGNRSLTITGPGRTVIMGVISNAASGFTGGLNLSGPGAVTLAGQNTYFGNTSLSGTATVRLGSSSIVQSGSIVSGPFSVNAVGVGGSGAVVTISGDDSATKRTVANRFNFNFGTFNFGDGVNDASLEFSGLMSSLFGGTTFTNNLSSGTLTFSGTLSPGPSGNQTMGFSGSGRTEVTGVIVNGTSASPTASNVSKNGNGALVMAGQSVYTGQTQLNAGVLALQAAENVGVSGPVGRGGAIVLSGGTLQYSSANQFDYSSRFSAGTSQRYSVDTNGQSVTWASNLTSSGGSLTKLGSGTLTLTGANTYTGTTTLNAGVVALGSAEIAATSGPLGRSAAANAGSIVLAGGALQYSASNNNDYSGRFSTAANQQYNVDTNGRNVTWATALSSSGGSLTKLGSGTLALNNANTYTGTTRIVAGSLSLGNGGALQNSTLDLNADDGGTIAAISTNGTFGGLAGSRDLDMFTRTLSIGNNNQSTTYSGVLSNGAVTKVGTGTLTLGGANAFGGVLTVADGAISVATLNNASANGPLGNSASAVVLGSTGKAGTLSYTGATASSNKPFTAATGGTAAFAVTDAAATLTLSGAIGGSGDASFGGPGSYVLSGGISAGNVFKTGTGALTLSVGNSQANTTVSEGQLNVNHLAALGTPAGTLTMAAGTRLDNTSGAAVTVTNPKSIALGSSLTFVGSDDLDLGTGTVTLSGNTEFTIAAKELTLSGDVLGAGFGITKTGAGTLRLDGLTGASSFTGNSFVNAGTLLLEGSSILGGGTSTVVTVADGAFLQIGAAAGLGDVTVVSRPAGIITATVVNANQTFDQSGTLTTSNGNFNGVQTIESGVTITAGHNYLGTVPATTTAGRIVFQDNAKIHVTTGFELNSKQGISLQSGTAIFESDANQALLIPSAVAGSGGIRKIGAGNIRLTGSNTYAGGTVIEEGIVGISYGESLGDVSGRLKLDGGAIVAAQVLSGSMVSTVTIDSGRSFVLANGKTSGMDAQTGLTLRYDGVIAEENGGGAAAGLRIGSGAPRQGTVILGGANTYRGDTTMSFGTLKLASGGSFANSARIIVGGSGSSGVSLDLTEKSSFSIGASQTLMGGGTVKLAGATVLNVQGVFSPGNSPGLFTYDGGTTALSGTTLMEIFGTSRATLPSHGSGFYDAVNIVNDGTLQFGGNLTFEFSSLFDNNSTFDLFTPASGSFLTGNFTGVTVTGGFYTGLSWNQTGPVWKSSNTAGGQSLEFNSTNGQLVIVPEPATIALAGIGLLLAGWAAARRQRGAL